MEEESEMSVDEVEVEGVGEGGEMDFIQFMDGVWYRRQDGDSIILLLEIGKRVYISGKAELQMVKGQVEVLGHLLTASNPTDNTGSGGSSCQKVFSPKGHSSLLYIEGKNCGQDFEGNIFPDGFAAVILRAFESPWTSGLRNTAANGDILVGPEIHVKNNTIHPRLVADADADVENLQASRFKLPKMKHFLDKFGFQLVPENLLDKNLLFVTDPAWDQFFDRIVEDRKNAGDLEICVFGGKGVGKSTFCRWLTNKLLQKDGQILYVDLDPGQTEFTPPGIISVHLVSQPLLGPNFSHLRNPEKAVFLGGVNVADFPAYYISGINELTRFADENYSGIPWIINTMGFSSGLGIPLAVSVIKIFRPSVLVQLTISNNPKSSFPFDLNPKNISTYEAPHFLMSNPLLNLPQTWSRSLTYNFLRIDSVFAKRMKSQDKSDFKNTPGSNNPKSLREAMLISYFSNIIGSTPDQSLLAVVPYRIKLQGLIIGSMNSNLNWDGVLSIIVGNLVALCSLPEEEALARATKAPNDSPPQSQKQSESEFGLPDPSKYFIPCCASLQNVTFMGYGLCRFHQKKTQELLVVTPLSTEQFSKVNLMISAGDMGLPMSLLSTSQRSKRHSSSSGSHSYISGSQHNAGGKKYFVPGKKSTHNSLGSSLFQ